MNSLRMFSMFGEDGQCYTVHLFVAANKKVKIRSRLLEEDGSLTSALPKKIAQKRF